jgi:hypothetical protein
MESLARREPIFFMTPIIVIPTFQAARIKTNELSETLYPQTDNPTMAAGISIAVIFQFIFVNCLVDF